MNWIYYLLEANLYLIAFYAFYKAFLHTETFYTWNRYYLLSTALIAFILPLLQVGYLFDFFGISHSLPADRLTMASRSNADQTDYTSLAFLLPALYTTVATAFFILLLAKTANILVLAARSKKNRYAQVIYLELDDDQTAFSFFGFLFINPSALEKDTIIRHELIHITQKHSLDVMLFELIQIISWFNPVIYLYKKDIKLLHEYIADELTTRVAVPKHEYAMLLIQNSFGAQSNALTNQIFNQSVLKKRISMLNKQKSGTNARLKMLLALPLAGGLICLSTMAFTKDYTVLDLYPVNQVIQEPTKVSPPPPPKEPRVSNVKRKKAGRTGTYVSPPPPPPIETPRVSNVRRKKDSKTGTYVTPPPPIEAPKVKEKMLPPPPPVEAPPARKVKKAKQDQVKFPPPIVKGN